MNLPYEVLNREVVRGDSDQPAVALTLDGGSVAAFTPAMLEILRQHEVQLTIFITGQFAERNPELVREMIADGHEIGNHSYAHPDFTELEDDAIRAELSRTEEIVNRVAGISTKPWFRFPFGARNSHVADVVAREGYRSIYWTIDTIDWREDATPALIMQRIRDRLGNGVIVLAHLGSPQTLEALPAILTELDEQGYRIVKVSELLYPPPATTPIPITTDNTTITAHHHRAHPHGCALEPLTVLCGFIRIQCTIEDAKGEDQEEYAAKAASREPGNGGSPVVRGQRNGPGSCDLKGRRITDKRDVGCIGSRVGVNGTPTVDFGAGIQPRERGVLE